MNWQLTLDDRAEPYPPPAHRRLTARQRDLVRWMYMAYGEITTVEGRLFFADPSGALRRLERAGMIEHVSRGHWRIVAHGDGGWA